MLPIYARLPRNPFELAINAHSGLLFDKFPDAWDEGKNYSLSDHAKKDFLTEIIKKYKETELTDNLKIFLTRQHDLLKQIQGKSVEVTTDWRFVSGLGAAHPYETGFIWHRTLSVPYLPGSSVKGMMRAFATHWGGIPEQNEITRLFGSEDGEAHCGALIVFDALPSKKPKLEIDILNPHYSEYYQDSATPPADYLSPIPVFFLTVAPAQDFKFFLAPRPGTSEQDLDNGLTLLLKALETLGIGGKTAVGYGVFKESEASEREREAKDIAIKKAIDEAANENAINAVINEMGITGLAKEIYCKVQEENWETNNSAFYESVPCYLQRIAEETDIKIQQDAISIVEEILEQKFKGIIKDPDKKEGKNKDKLVYKPKAIEIVKRLLDIKMRKS